MEKLHSRLSFLVSGPVSVELGVYVFFDISVIECRNCVEARGRSNKFAKKDRYVEIVLKECGQS